MGEQRELGRISFGVIAADLEGTRSLTQHPKDRRDRRYNFCIHPAHFISVRATGQGQYGSSTGPPSPATFSYEGFPVLRRCDTRPSVASLSQRTSYTRFPSTNILGNQKGAIFGSAVASHETPSNTPTYVRCQLPLTHTSHFNQFYCFPKQTSNPAPQIATEEAGHILKLLISLASSTQRPRAHFCQSPEAYPRSKRRETCRLPELSTRTIFALSETLRKLPSTDSRTLVSIHSTTARTLHPAVLS